MTGTSAGWRALRWFLALLLVTDVVGAFSYTTVVGAWSWTHSDVLGGVVLAVPYGVVGLLIATRRPGVPIGWLLLLCGVLWSQGLWTIWPTHIVDTGGHLSGLAAFVADDQWVPWPVVAVPAIQLTLLLLPDGRLRSPRWRPVAIVTVAAMVVASLSLMLAPGPVDTFPQLHHPGIPGARPVLTATLIVAAVVLFVSAAVNFVGLFVEYRHADGVERQQLRWLAVGGCGAVLALVLGALTSNGSNDAGSVLSGLGMAMIPTSIGVAVLRYRLYDLDRLLSRAVAYLLLTGVLAGVYLAIAATFGLVAGGNTIGVAAGTLVAAALFQPLRRRMQHVVDRRFNRARYDATRTVDAFAGRLRDTMSTQSVVEDLLQVTGGVLEPATASVWLRPAG